MEKLSRRGFLAGAAVMGSSVALSACAGQSNAASVASGADASEISWSKETDVVVVGSGTGGMSAALTAVKAGASVVVIEQYEITGGASSACGAWACASTEPLSPATPDGPNADTMFETFTAVGENSADPELLRIVCEKSVEAIQFLIDEGVEFNPESTNYGTYVRHGAPSGTGVTTLTANFEAAGGELLKSTKLTEIIRDAELGRVTGIKATGADGAEIAIKAAKAVIIASGLWTNDESMVLRHQPTIPPDVLEGGTVYAQQGIPFGPFDGSAIKAAQKVQAAVRGMEYIAGEPYYSTLEYLKKGVAHSGILRTTDEVHLNLDGKRFYDEGNPSRGAMSKIIAKQKDHCYLSVLDSKYIPSRMYPFYTPEQLDQWVADGDVIKANTLEELAAQVEETWGAPAEVVLKTLTDYNTYCDSGVDPEFGKDAQFLVKFDTPPFWTGPTFTYHALYSFGGLDADAEARVRDIDGEVIPGLYAAGFCAGGHFGVDGLTGANQTNACIFGRIAGANAAAENTG